jgi:hypothetical protein
VKAPCNQFQNIRLSACQFRRPVHGLPTRRDRAPNPGAPATHLNLSRPVAPQHEPFGLSLTPSSVLSYTSRSDIRTKE